ncbi:clostripain-related cysteine peptidase [Bacteroides sp.]|uniref:clostripain-related cysteine peptidase n=1 Tax=Bacteroides sp. TaxID=29523 RepID=UPI003A912D7B
MKIRFISIFLIIPLLLSSCLQEEADNIRLSPNRTVLFYMAGDNSLGGETQEKIDALAQAWNIVGDNHLLVYQDRGGEYMPRLLEIKTGIRGEGTIEVLEEYADENSASRAVFSRVLNDMTRHYPGSDYGLVMFSHGSGWLPAGTFSSNTCSVAMDGDREFDLPDFAGCIPRGQFHFIIFESCLMAGAEVAYELQDKTDYILASSAEIVSPGFTPLYGKMLPLLYSREPQLEKFAAEYYNYCNSLAGDMRSATVSVIRPSLLAPLKSLLAQAEKRIRNWDEIDRDGIQAFDRRSTHLFYDLESYFHEIGTPQETEALADILRQGIVYQASTESFMPSKAGGFQVKEHCGLTIYIPVNGYGQLNIRRKRLLLFSEN